MTKDGTSALTPRLRFPRFRNASGWKSNLLSGIADPVVERAEAGDGGLILTLSGEHGIILQSEYFGKQVAGTNSERYIKIIRDDFVYNDRTTKQATYGTIKRLTHQDGGIVSPIYKCFRFGIGENPTFWGFYFESRIHDVELKELVNEGARAGRFNISIDKFLSTTGWRPEHKEQKKIADCLMSLDDVIAAQVRKVDALKTYKRGLMQQLFPRKGESIPRLRFPEFRLEWKERPLHELAGYENGKAYEQDIQDGGKYVVVNSRFISTDGEIRKYSSANHCLASKGDVLMVLSDLPNGRALAKCFYVDSNDEYAVNQRVARLAPSDVHPKFLYYRLNRHPNLLAFDDGLNQTHLSKGSVIDCPLFVPPERSEQRQIAECLSLFDSHITAESNKLCALKTHKKGLMQKLFPVLDEASA